MSTYHSSAHAIKRAQERFPDFGFVLKDWNAWTNWLASAAGRGRVASQQEGMDLMLRVEVNLSEGTDVIYLPVRPLAEGHDRWIITTVLTREQGELSIRLFQERRREQALAAWEAYRRHGRAAKVRGRIAARRAHAA